MATMEEENQQQQQTQNFISNPQSQQEQEQQQQEGLGFVSSNATSFSEPAPPSPPDCNSSSPGFDPATGIERGEESEVRELKNLSLNELGPEGEGQVEATIEEPREDVSVGFVEQRNDHEEKPLREVVLEGKEVNMNDWEPGDEHSGVIINENEGWIGEDNKGSNHGDSENGDSNEYGKREEGFDGESDSWSDNENAKGECNENEKEGRATGTWGASKIGRSWRHQYPLRPEAEDCAYYMKTGTCKFGSSCKFNHPPRRKNLGVKEKIKQNEENQEKPAQMECKYYLTSGGCKFGSACRYNHSREKTLGPPALELNFIGLPIRSGEKECPYYMRTGSCSYGSNCRFNHPDPMAVGGNESPGYANGVSEPTMSSWGSPMTLNGTASYVPVVLPPVQGVSSTNSGWNKYQASSVYSTSERSLPTPPAFSMNNPAAETNFYPHQQLQIPVEFPERPGQPECSYFLKTGDCKFKSNCKFHHPKSRISKISTCVLSDKGLPLRPDQNICTHYSRYGICKFGPSCKYDHPVNYDKSASSAGPYSDQPPLSNYEWS